MNNEQEIEKLLEKFYDGTIEQAELDRLCSWFLHTDEVPPKWRADAILLRSIGIERYCNRHKQEFAAFVDSHLPSKAGKRKTVLRNVFAHYGYGAAAAAICFVLTFTATSAAAVVCVRWASSLTTASTRLTPTSLCVTRKLLS